MFHTPQAARTPRAQIELMTAFGDRQAAMLGVAGQPLGLVEVRGRLGPVLVVGLEPDGPLAGVLAGEQAR